MREYAVALSHEGYKKVVYPNPSREFLFCIFPTYASARALGYDTLSKKLKFGDNSVKY